MKLFLGLLSFALLSPSDGAYDCLSDTGTYTVKVDPHASEFGFFTFEECPDMINPVIAMVVDEIYTFAQADRSNYYHPMGFAYDVDGALEGSPELEPGNTPPGSASTCADDLTCPAPIYYNGVQLEDYTNLLDNQTVGSEFFGLDVYEPEFFYPLGDWATGNYYIKLRFTESDIDQDIFFFCHIHAGMSGRIKLLNTAEEELVEDNTPTLPYEYVAPEAFDAACGTNGLENFQLPVANAECPVEFVCLGDTSDQDLIDFAGCINAMNCAMLSGMTSSVDGTQDLGALFSYQMIPHHQNAVNMAKALLFSGDLAACDDLTVDSDACEFEKLVREIIVAQNFQIQAMQGVLDAGGYSEQNDCSVEVLQEDGIIG